MTTLPTALPYGMRDIKLRPLTGEVAGASIDLPNSRQMQFAETESFSDLRGDDGIAASHGSGPSVNWQLEGGGVSFEAVVAMYGGTIITTGVSPNKVKTLSKKSTDTRPYFQAEGQAISDSGGDFHLLLYRCKATGDLAGTMQDGNFWLTGASGNAIGRDSDKAVWDWVQNETETPIDA
jgi:hypothetical protein